MALSSPCWALPSTFFLKDASCKVLGNQIGVGTVTMGEGDLTKAVCVRKKKEITCSVVAGDQTVGSTKYSLEVDTADVVVGTSNSGNVVLLLMPKTKKFHLVMHALLAQGLMAKSCAGDIVQ